MLATLRFADGGNCDEADAGVGKCGDHWGAPVTLPANGKWMQNLDADLRRRVPAAGIGRRDSLGSDPGTGVQIQSADLGQTYDFWIDDVYLLR